MQVSDLFIRRPVFSVVVSLLLIVGGLASLLQMPVREYPQVDPPVVSVNTVYRGASNEVIESRITELVEGAVAGLEGIRQINSESRNDRSSVTIEFNVSRAPEAGGLRRARRRLAHCLSAPGRRRHAGRAQGRCERRRHHVGRRHLLDLRRARTLRLPEARLCRPLATVDGVANVYIGGERRYAMRIWIDRPALSARG
jgi:multidrug efflux pump